MSSGGEYNAIAQKVVPEKRKKYTTLLVAITATFPGTCTMCNQRICGVDSKRWGFVTMASFSPRG